MTASYPSSVKSFVTKIDFADTVFAAHVNDLQDEVNAVQANLGTAIKVGSGWVGSFDQVTTTWNSLKDRIANIEYGLGNVYNDAVRLSGGSIVQPSGTSTVNLTLKAQTSQTANLLELKNSSNSVVLDIDSSGNIDTSGNVNSTNVTATGTVTAASRQLVPIVYSASQPSSVPAGTIWVDSSSDVALLTAQSGVPSGGLTNQSLVKSSNSDYATTWAYVVPVGGTNGQYLAKNSDTDFDLTWRDYPDVVTTNFLLGGI